MHTPFQLLLKNSRTVLYAPTHIPSQQLYTPYLGLWLHQVLEEYYQLVEDGFLIN